MNNTRALLVSFLVLLSFVGLVVQLFTVQVGGHDKYLARAERQQNKLFNLKAERGIIYDRNGEILAYTKDDVTLYADSRMLKKSSKHRDKIANELAKVFNQKPSKYIRLIKNGKGNVVLERKIPKEKSLMLNSLVVDGFFKTEDYTRVYPYGNITSHLLGYVNKDCEGIAGLEKLFDDELNGKDGKLFVENDAIGRAVTIDFDNSIPAVPGNSFHLTIDKVYQKILVNELKKGLKEYEGKSAIGIIANPNNGEILALANVPDFNPNNYSKVSNYVKRNRALTDAYEPGSTMKSIVMAMMLDKGLVKESEIINTENGKYRIKGAIIRDTHKFKRLSVREVLEQSSNIGIVKLSDRISSRDFYKGLRDFGFGNVTSIDLLGEAKGKLKKPDNYSGISKAFIAHGYEISATPLQMIMAYSALINGGYLLQPYVVKDIVDSRGNIIKKNTRKKIRRVISGKTSLIIKDMMKGVVENGTGHKAQQTNIYVGGKTGTSQKLINGRYSSKNYNSSFIGFFPVENPQVVCLVLVDSPQKGRYGGQVAAPIFSNITKKIMETDFNIPRNKNAIERNIIIEEFADNLQLDNTDDELMSFANVSKKEKLKNSKEKITRSVMPNLVNKSLREAISILSELNIGYTIKGNGKVKKQSIKEGTPINKTSECVLFCFTGE